jgi:hypothetical protein
VEDAAKELIEGVRGRIATLTIAPKEAYKDLSVKLDGAPLATAALGDKLPLNPGTHKLTAEAPGRRPFEESFSVAAKETKTVAIELAVDPAATAASPTPSATAGGAPNGPGTPDRGGGPGPLPVALLVGGGAAVVGGVVFLVVSAVRGDSIDEECGGPERKACPKSRTKDINDEIQGVKNFQILGGVIGGVGVIAAGVGTALLLTAPSAHAASTGKGVWVAPAVSVSGIGVAARGTF